MAYLLRFSVSPADAGTVELVTSALWDLGTTAVFESGDELVAGFDDRQTALDASADLAARAAVVTGSVTVDRAPTVDAWDDRPPASLTLD